jgi:transposase
MEIVYLRSQKLENKRIQQICGISKATFYRYLHAYQAGGVEKLKELSFHRPESQLVEHRRTLEGYFREPPPATSAEAAARIEELSGIKRGPTQTREFLKKLGMKPRKVGQIPAKADGKEQEGSKEEKLEPRLAEAKAGNRGVTLREVFGAYLQARKSLKPRTVKDMHDAMKGFEDWLKKPLLSITRDMIAKRHKVLVCLITSFARNSEQL